jgi:6-phosphofructokinase 1
VYVPERPFSTERFLSDIRAVRERHGRCVVAMSEGVTSEDGRPVVESLLGSAVERDAHGNLQLSTGDLGIAVQSALSEAFPKVRARVDTFGYLPRAFAATVSDLDRREAFDVGAYAVEAAEQGSCSVTLGTEAGGSSIGAVPLASVAGQTRLMPADFLDPAGNRLSPAGMAYLSRLIPPPPQIFSPFL